MILVREDIREARQHDQEESRPNVEKVKGVPSDHMLFFVDTNIKLPQPGATQTEKDRRGVIVYDWSSRKAPKSIVSSSRGTTVEQKRRPNTKAPKSIVSSSMFRGGP